MTKFLESLELQLDHRPQRRAKPPKLLARPITLDYDYVRMGMQDRYSLILHWEVGVWLDVPVLPSVKEEAEKETINELKHLIYGEIYGDLYEVKHMIKYGDIEDALDHIERIMKKIGFPMEVK